MPSLPRTAIFKEEVGPSYALSSKLADRLPPEAYSFLERPPRYEITTAPRQQPERVKQQIVRERGFETIHTLEEMVAEFEYCPVACHRSYRVIVVRKLLGTDKGQMRLFEEYRYFWVRSQKGVILIQP